MPTCHKCKTENPSCGFYPDKRKKSGLQGICKQCQKQWITDNPDYQMDWMLTSKYGVTLAMYNKMVDDQNGLCASCGCAEWRTDSRSGKMRNLCVDHDHETGAIRGLLCDDCNVAIGRLKDDPYRAMSIYKYLCIYTTMSEL